MKNAINLVALICVMFFTVSSFAQDENDSSNGFFSNLDVGVRAGFNYSNMYGDVGDNEYLPSFNLGVVVDHAINDQWGASVEPHLSIEGQKMDNGGYNRITYFNIPILAKFKVAEKFSIDGGPKVGIKITEKTKFGTTGETDNTNRFKRIAPGITLGSTYSINQKWFAQFRFNVKFSDVVRDEGGDTEGSTIRLFQLGVGYALD